jgi:predicted RNase H-like nuclease
MLVEGAALAQRILIDIPIGMTSHEGNTRTCDWQARKRLGARACTVFTAPCREAIEAGTYQEACDRNKAVTGKKLSRQCWAIVPKIKEVDRLMRTDPAARSLLRESHPELCFASLRRGRPIAQNKKTTEGFQARIEVLETHCPNAGRIIDMALSTSKRSEVARDDIVDSLVLAVAASLPDDQLTFLPEEPICDIHGLPMEVVLPNLREFTIHI